MVWTQSDVQALAIGLGAAVAVVTVVAICVTVVNLRWAKDDREKERQSHERRLQELETSRELNKRKLELTAELRRAQLGVADGEAVPEKVDDSDDFSISSS